MMKRKTTRDLLSLGMALRADRSTMEQRIRGIFSKRSSKAATAFAVLIAVFLTVGCFTTACRPVTAERAAQLPSVTPEPEGIPALREAVYSSGNTALRTVSTGMSRPVQRRKASAP